MSFGWSSRHGSRSAVQRIIGRGKMNCIDHQQTEKNNGGDALHNYCLFAGLLLTYYCVTVDIHH